MGCWLAPRYDVRPVTKAGARDRPRSRKRLPISGENGTSAVCRVITVSASHFGRQQIPKRDRIVSKRPAQWSLQNLVALIITRISSEAQDRRTALPKTFPSSAVSHHRLLSWLIS